MKTIRAIAIVALLAGCQTTAGERDALQFIGGLVIIGAAVAGVVMLVP